MRSHCAVYVDVGYLLASAATRVAGSSFRRAVTIDYPALVSGLVEQAEADSGLPLLRVNWYDSGSRSGVADPGQEDIGLLPRVKLRLGRRSYSGDQKGVDVRLGLDLAIQGRNRVADVIYLVSGDDDLTEAVEEAQAHGVQVVLLAVPDREGRPHAVAKHLGLAADGVLPIHGEVIDRTVRPQAIPAALVPHESTEDGAGQTPRAAVESASGPQPPKPGPRPAPPAAATPGAATPGEAGAGEGQVDEGHPTPSVLAHKRASQLHLPEPAVAAAHTGPRVDAEGHPTDESIDAVARQVVAAWCTTATPQALAELKASHPQIPAELDRVLLVDLSSHTEAYDLEESTRFRLRERFWVHVERVRIG
ncbi:MAG: NYN domain-containing protein [Micrococcales bacterium]|nr:NYN domain-containing protein [Micrococcales bacterium]